MEELENIIADSVTDAQLPPEPEVETPEVPASTEATADPAETPETPEGVQVSSPTAAEETSVEPPAEQDEFEKQFGIPAQSIPGRENRIPYSRVKKIVQKAVKDEAERLGKEYTPKVQDLETKVKDYEDRLVKVDRFEQTLLNDPQTFLDKLATLPAYQPFFEAVQRLIDEKSGSVTPETPDAPVSDDMPLPNKPQPDGSSVYDMEGLRSLLAWNTKRTRDEVLKQVEEQYGPIKQEWQHDQQIKAVTPQIRAKIAEARTWPKFQENEEEITQFLKNNPKADLEAAYRQVVFPKVVADRDAIRQEVLKELKTAPRATAVAASPTKVAPTAPSGSKSLEDIIAESIKELK